MNVPFKRYLPKSLFGRSLLIIILPILVMQIAVAYVFFDRHWQTVTSSLSDGVAADIALAVQLYDQDPGQSRSKTLDAMLRPHMQLSVQLNPAETLPTNTRKSFFSTLDKTLRRSLSQTLDAPFWFDTTRYPNYIDIRVGVDEGVLTFIAARERVFAPTGFIFIFWLVTATAALSLVSIVFIRNQAKPIRELADAADAFGVGRDLERFKPSGASEVRRAGQSFIQMRRRIQRHIEQRALLLAGVSHDIRTPLTRLKLHLAMEEDSPDTRAAKQDVADMEVMLEGYLNFAKGLEGENPELTDIGAMLTDIVEAEHLILTGDLTTEVRPVALKRAIQNLIDNARSFANSVTVTAERTSGRINIIVDDNGPGIPDDQRDDAFKPFQRLDVARNQNRKGVGLGLSITLDVAQSHGGSVILADSPLGGLRATFWVPV